MTEDFHQRAAAVVRRDLDAICEDAADELHAMAGKRLLIAGGAGFLGITSCRRRCTGTAAPRRRAHRRDGLRQLHPRHRRRGSRRWPATRDSRSSRTTSPSRCRTASARRLHRPRGVDRLADLLPQAPDRDDGRQRQRPAPHCSIYAERQQAGGRPVRGFLFFSSSEIYGDPTPENIPTPENYRGLRVVHRAARLLRRVQALRRDAVRELRRQQGCR